MNLSIKQKWSYRCRKQTYVDQKVEKVKVKSLSHVQLCDPMDCGLQDSSIHGVFQARELEWVAISFSRISDFKKPYCMEHIDEDLIIITSDHTLKSSFLPLTSFF